MKKLFVVLFCTFVMAGYTFADELSYEIDPVATAKAPWKVGELIFKEGRHNEHSRYRKFLGVTDSGQVLIQEFYTRSGKKATNPFLVSSIDVAKLNGGGSFEREIDGEVISWYENGQKAMEVTFQNGAQGLFREWHDNGQKSVEGHVKDNKEVGVWRRWDEEGRLIEEKDYGTPED